MSDLNRIVLPSLSDTVGSGVTDPVSNAELIDFITHGTGCDNCSQINVCVYLLLHEKNLLFFYHWCRTLQTCCVSCI